LTTQLASDVSVFKHVYAWQIVSVTIGIVSISFSYVIRDVSLLSNIRFSSCILVVICNKFEILTSRGSAAVGSVIRFFFVGNLTDFPAVGLKEFRKSVHIFIRSYC